MGANLRRRHRCGQHRLAQKSLRPGEARSGRTSDVCWCGREQAAGERGWKGYPTTDEDEPAEAVAYCPDCAAREFGVNLLDEGD